MAEGINRLFAKFATWYGRHWLDMWAGIDMGAVKAEWASELSRFSGVALKHGLEECKRRKFPPTLPEFIDYCANTPRHLYEQRDEKLALPEKACFLGEEEARKRLAEICREVGIRTKAAKGVSGATEEQTH